MNPTAQRHYFIADAQARQTERTWDVTLLGHPLRFTACAGLFSYEHPDAASVILLESIHSARSPLHGALLDLGCGYGLIGIGLAKSYPVVLTMSDINEVACAYAEKNAAANSIHARVLHSDGFARVAGCFHHITLNPPIHAGKDVMYRLFEESAVRLHPGGALYIVIQTKHGAKSTLAFLTGLFEQVNILYKRKGYFVACCVTGR